MFTRQLRIVSKSKRQRRLASCFALALAGTEIASVLAESEIDNWRRTPRGWERVESWDRLLEPPIGQLRPLTIDTLLQRTWPASIAAAQLFLVLAVLHYSKQSNAGSKVKRPIES